MAKMEEVVISLEQVSKAYGDTCVLQDFSLQVHQGSFVTIIGRSGCGKTTALKLVNGLITPDSGRVLVQGQDVSQVKGELLRRNIGYAIQNVGLFPHMTVGKNIGYVPAISKLSGWKGEEGREKICSLLTQVGLGTDLIDRYPRSLSGGQRQRVGIARALAAQPEILLMDEPFGAVDEITRGQLQDEILRIHQEKQLTVLFVTHDISEALKLGTQVLVMEGGQVEQLASPSQLLNQPATDFVADLVCRNRGFSLRV